VAIVDVDKEATMVPDVTDVLDPDIVGTETKTEDETRADDFKEMLDDFVELLDSVEELLIVNEQPLS
jgi:hypothetical protein